MASQGKISDLGGIANRLYEGFLAPLVIGGEMTPGKPIGGRAALAMGRERVLANPELASHVQLGRNRAARVVANDRAHHAHPRSFIRDGCAQRVRIAQRRRSFEPHEPPVAVQVGCDSNVRFFGAEPASHQVDGRNGRRRVGPVGIERRERLVGEVGRGAGQS